MEWENGHSLSSVRRPIQGDVNIATYVVLFSQLKIELNLQIFFFFFFFSPKGVDKIWDPLILPLIVHWISFS